MTQMCRYCSNFLTGNGNYCEAKNIEPTDKYAKNPNRCKEFEFNPIDAFGETSGYRPRKRQCRRFDGQMELKL